jgi:hypothetical protein
VTLLTHTQTDLNRKLAFEAHYGTSFDPDKRADQEVDSYMTEMAALVAEFEPFATEANEAELAVDLEAYRVHYLKLIHAKLAADSRCMSSMITGPSNFPVARNQKRLDTAHKRLEEFLDWRKKALDRLHKKYDPRRMSTVISADDSDAVQQLKVKIDLFEAHQILMKAANKIVKSNLPTDEKIEKLVELGMTFQQAKELFTLDYMGNVGFPAYALTNNSANIRRMKERIADLEREAAKRQPETERDIMIGGVPCRLVENADANRLQLIFDGKPAETVRAMLKSNGFHWSPREGAWQRQLNDNSRRTVERLMREVIK